MYPLSVFSRVFRSIKALCVVGKPFRLMLMPFCLLCLTALSSCHMSQGVLDPKGLVAKEERTLMMDSIALMLIVVIPVIIMSFAFAFRYRKTHDNKSKYRPDWAHNSLLETLWWGVPCVIIVILGIMTWKYSHKLDPYRKLDVPGKPMIIEAVALRWKWLFIYPGQNIATINYVDVPKDKPFEFYITSDAPMSSLFIPQLGSQIYAMAGMRTRLNLVANEEGVYQGLNTQFNGKGFSDMEFKVHVTSQAGFDHWVKNVKASKQNSKLTIAEYKKLWQPIIHKDKFNHTVPDEPEFFNSVTPNLFKRIMWQYTKKNMSLH
jgi:cytochrome o ubiquinol oxidase subunit II